MESQENFEEARPTETSFLRELTQTPNQFPATPPLLPSTHFAALSLGSRTGHKSSEKATRGEHCRNGGALGHQQAHVPPLYLVSGSAPIGHPDIKIPEFKKSGLFSTPHFFFFLIPKGKPAAYSGTQHEFCRHNSFPFCV